MLHQPDIMIFVEIASRQLALCNWLPIGGVSWIKVIRLFWIKQEFRS